VSETQTCLSLGSDMSGNHLWNPAKKPDKTGVTRDKADRLDMFGLDLWNPAKKPNKVGVTRDKAERLDMSELGAGHVCVRSLEAR
jgi:hypothetical protein